MLKLHIRAEGGRFDQSQGQSHQGCRGLYSSTRIGKLVMKHAAGHCTRENERRCTKELRSATFWQHYIASSTVQLLPGQAPRPTARRHGCPTCSAARSTAVPASEHRNSRSRTGGQSALTCQPRAKCQHHPIRQTATGHELHPARGSGWSKPTPRCVSGAAYCLHRHGIPSIGLAKPNTPVAQSWR